MLCYVRLRQEPDNKSRRFTWCQESSLARISPAFARQFRSVDRIHFERREVSRRRNSSSCRECGHSPKRRVEGKPEACGDGNQLYCLTQTMRASTTLIQSAPPTNRRHRKASFYCAMLLQSAAFAVKFCHSVIILVYTHRDSVKMPGRTATELSMGPFCVTRSNPTYQLTGPTQSITSG